MMYESYYVDYKSDYEIHKDGHDGRFPFMCSYCNLDARLEAEKLQDELNNKPIPNCEYCNEKPAYGDERNAWLGAHNAWWHKLRYAIKRFFLV